MKNYTNHPYNGDYSLNLACCLRDKKYIVKPSNIIKAALKNNPEHMGLNLALLQLVSDMGESEKAKVLLKILQAINMTPNDNEHRSIQFITSATNVYSCIQTGKNWEKEKEKGIGPLWLDKVFDSKKRNQNLKLAICLVIFATILLADLYFQY